MISILRRYIFTLPIVYLAIAIFAARDHVQLVYLAAGLLVFGSALLSIRTKRKPLYSLGLWMTILAAIGLSAAIILSIEKIELLADPNHIASCSLSPVVACSPIIASPQASAFGFPNSFIGIFGFAAVLAAGYTILAGATKLATVWWRTLLGGIFCGAAFSSWLIYQGVFVIGKLCLYCLLVWIVSFALLWLVTAFMINAKHISLGRRLNSVLSHPYECIATTYAIIFMIILYAWFDYWVSLVS